MSSPAFIVVANTNDQGDVLRDVIDERKRQDAKWGNSDHWSPAEWSAILAEEYGEAAQEFCALHWAAGERSDIRERLRAELIQVAAMAVKIIERIDRGEV